MEEAGIDERKGRDGYGVARILGLSDGIFAIAMTLLVLDLPVPQIAHATNAELLNALVELRPNFASFVLSFSLVGLNWMVHHRMLRAVSRVDQRLLQLNLIQLLLVCFVPFTAALLSRYGDLATAVTFYAANLSFMGIIGAVVRLHLTRANLLDPDPGPGQLRLALAGSLGSTIVFAASILIALWNPNAAEYFWFVLFPMRLVVSRLPRQLLPRKIWRPRRVGWTKE